MLALDVQRVDLQIQPGQPCRARIEVGGLTLEGVTVRWTRHGPLVSFPTGNGHNRPPFELTPLLRNRVVESVLGACKTWKPSVSAWSQS